MIVRELIEQVRYEVGDYQDDLYEEDVLCRHLYHAYVKWSSFTGNTATLAYPPSPWDDVGTLSQLSERLWVLYTVEAILRQEMVRQARLNVGDHSSAAGRIDTRRVAAETAEIIKAINDQIDILEGILRGYNDPEIVKLNMVSEIDSS